jgi:hypothetical protein
VRRAKRKRASKELGGMARRTTKSKPIKNNNKGIFFGMKIKKNEM